MVVSNPGKLLPSTSFLIFPTSCVPRRGQDRGRGEKTGESQGVRHEKWKKERKNEKKKREFEEGESEGEKNDKEEMRRANMKKNN